ncbi:MAG TPA: DUF2079 domain-containing protein [Micromonosporaceae bacterium]|nr:DUF2079 domain-containing protein [Micromonosporaceae bacterium]
MPRPTPVRRHRRADLLTALASLVLAGWVTGALWLAPNGRAILVNSGDQALFEWLLAYGAHALRTGENPLFTYLLNVPDGVNLAVNTSITVYALALAPVTWLIGPPLTFLLVLTLNLAATGYAWYWLLSRHLGASAPAAALGGIFCGFAPGLISHANAHLNWTAQWLVPIVVWRVVRLREPGRAVRNGALLGVLVAVMFSIAAEALFFTAIGCGLFVGVWALGRRDEARAALRTFLAGLGVTGLVALVLLAYPLWLHFLGPQRYAGIGFDQRMHAEDLAAYGAYPQRSVAGWLGLDTPLAPNPTEETSFFGVPLLVLFAVCFALLWARTGAGRRRAVLRALAVTAVAFTVLSLGPQLKWMGEITDVPLPYALLAPLPIFNAALPARLALGVIPVIAIVLAWAVDHLRTTTTLRRPLWIAAFATALLPLVPVPLIAVERDPVPEFFASGQWRSYVSPGGTVVPVPLPSDLLPDGQRWQSTAFAARHGEFAIPSGFFLGPGGPDGRGRIGPVPRPTEELLVQAAYTGIAPIVGDAERRRAREDLRYWRAEVIVLADQVHGSKWTVHYATLRQTATALFGEPQRVSDVWLWRVPPS